MNILEYDEVDPLGVLSLNLLSLRYALTPELVRLTRQLDKRPFPFFALYAVEDDQVIGQVGVFRLPTVTSEGTEDVSGIWAVCTHPSFGQRGVASILLEEAHERMRSSGLRFSTLGTSRYRKAHRLYLQHEYQDAVFTSYAIAPCEHIQDDQCLRTERAGLERLHLADDIFKRASMGRLGFAWRHEVFIPAMVKLGNLNLDEVWLLMENDEPVGYAIATTNESVLMVHNLLLLKAANVASAVAALIRGQAISYAHVRVDHPSIGQVLQEAGFPPEQFTWGSFMLKPLIPKVAMEDAHRLWGIGSEKFLISDLDIT